MWRTIPRWVYAGAAAGLLALSVIVLAPDAVLAGTSYRRLTPTTVTLVLGADAGFDTINAFTVKADSFQTHTADGPMDIATAGAGDVELGNSTSGVMTLSGGDATFSGNITSVVDESLLVSTGSVVASNSIQAPYYQITTSGFLNVASGASIRILNACDSRADSTFPQTCNEVGGLSTVAGSAGTTPFVINNSLALSDQGICSAHFTAFHSGCTTIYCVVSAGALTFQTNANCLISAQDFTWTLDSTGLSP